MNFNSHAHVERDRKTLQRKNQQRISTHTLTWSVTCIYTACFISKCISTHTLTWSVTRTTQTIAGGVFISTHTLTWSVTLCSRLHK